MIYSKNSSSSWISISMILAFLTPLLNAWGDTQEFRLRSFNELMSPAFKNKDLHIPYSNGSKLLPMNLLNIIWADFKIAEDWRVLYWQRSILEFTDSDGARKNNLILRNPRFAIRKTHVFNIPNLDTTYDLYIQPGWTQEATHSGRDLEAGLRTSTSYDIPSSRWSFGFISETTFSASFRKAPAGSSSFYGWLMPWVSYRLNSIFSLEHYLTLSFQHVRGHQGLEPDYPMPLNTQNGIGIALTEKVSATLLINHYLNAAPKWSNTWASLWLSVTVF